MSDQSKPMTLTKEDFDTQVLDSEQPVLVDFWAAWCQPCLMLAPTIEQLADEYGDKVKVAKVDIDAYPELGSAYQVNSIPTVILFDGGRVAQKFVGLQSKDVYAAEIDKLIS